MTAGRGLFALLVLLALCGSAGAETKGSIRYTKHNLSSSGPGDIKSVTETRICIFCHSSHNGSSEGPLWNHESTKAGAFKTYDRATLQGYPQQPNGATKLCLSCHDGTIAVGAVKSIAGEIKMHGVGAQGGIPVSKASNFGRDLSGMHPVSVPFSEKTALGSSSLRWPPFDLEKQVGVDAGGFVQCTACHDPHGSRSKSLPFWNKDSFSKVCNVCHSY